MSASILGIGTAAPPSLSQAAVAELGVSLCCDDDKQASFLRRVFERAGIEQRGSVLVSGDPARVVEELERFYKPRCCPADRGPTTQQRMMLYAQHAPPLAIAASLEALQSSGSVASEITHLITVSCTGFFSPGVDVALIESLGMSPGVQRQHIGFMGCHAAFNALASARDIVASSPSARVLICCVELCTLHFAYGWDPQRVVANSLFADGAAAAVVGGKASDSAWHIRQTSSLLVHDSRSAMTWNIGNHGFEMTLAPEVPRMVESQLAAWCDRWLACEPREIEHFVIHPGGPKVITAVGTSLAVDESKLSASRSMLLRRGNMSSTTILFLIRELRESQARGKCLALGFGPGLMMEGMLLERD